MKNGTLAPILGALIRVRGGLDSGFGRLSERRPSAIVGLRSGKRFRLSGRLEEMARGQPLDSARRRARRGAGGQTQMGENSDYHRRRFDSGDDLQAAATIRAVFDVDLENPLE